MNPNSSWNKLKALFGNRCPRCHRGKFWAYSNPYYNLLFKGGKMNENCDKCGLKYEMESGFWYGGMYVSYAINVALLITGVVVSEIFFDEVGVWEEAGVITAVMIFLIPVTFYLSRLIWINFFVKYDPTKWQDPSNKDQAIQN